MAEEKPRLARLTAILTQLQSKRMVTARMLADKHQVSIRTIYRDIRTLEQSGVPIVTEEGKGYTLGEGYILPPVMFTEAEANALLTAEQLIRHTTEQSLITQYTQAITKIKAVLRQSQKKKIEFLADRIQIRTDENQGQPSAHLISLQSAITNFQVVQIQYRSLQQQYTERTLEPFALYTTKGNWILIAFCRLRKAFRAFRLDCIQKLQVTTECFEPHDMTLEYYLEECRKTWNTP